MPKTIENTVFVRFLPPPQHKVLRHQLEDIFSQIGPIKKSSWINAKASLSVKGKDAETPPHSASLSKGYGFVKYVIKDDAIEAPKQFHNTKIQMEGREYTLKVELASNSSVDNNNVTTKEIILNDAKNLRTSDSHCVPDFDIGSVGDESTLVLLKKKSRIIVRNLSFYAKENHIRKVMESKYGKVVDIHLPQVQNKLHMGFCFVTFEDPSDAQKAVMEKQIDIKKRTVDMDWSSPKKVHQQHRQERRNVRGPDMESTPVVSRSEGNDGSSKDCDEISNNQSIESRNEENEGKESDDACSYSMTDILQSGKPSDDDKHESCSIQAVSEMDDSVRRKCCLFLRNLPFDATRRDLFRLFSIFGYINSIHLVKDKDSGMPKGTAFVTYSNPRFAERALQKASMSNINTRLAPFLSKSGSKTEVEKESLKFGGSLMLKDRNIVVDLAVDKETASAFDSNDKKVFASDRRNLYLQAESRVESTLTEPKTSKANTWDDLPQQDQKKRQSALKDKMTKLQSPIFFINPNRLSFRNLAKDVDEVGLQKLCEIGVKRGVEKRLVGAEDQIAHWRARGEMSTREILAKVQENEANNEDIIPCWDDKRNIKDYIPSVYIDRDYGSLRKKADTPSRGFGFVEFAHHAHALACLRELNNNPTYSCDYVAGGKTAHGIKKSKKMKKGVGSTSGAGDYVGQDGRIHVPRLIVDFTVENKIKAKKQAERRLQQQLNETRQHFESVDKNKNQAKERECRKRRSRGFIQREKKRQKRESGEEEEEIEATRKARALLEAKEKLRKVRQELEKKRAEEGKRGFIRSRPKKKTRKDDEDETFDNIVRSYATKLDAALQKNEASDSRSASKGKRWFE